MLAALLIVGCGGASASGAGTGADASEAPIRYVDARGPSAANYTTETTESARTNDPHGDRLESVAVTILADANREVRPDGRLTELAVALGEEIADQGDMPSAEVVQFMARHLGLVEPIPAVAFVAYQAVEDMEASMEARFLDFLSADAFTHFGIATRPGSEDGERIAIFTAARRDLEMTPLPRRREAGPMMFSGEMASTLQNPEIALHRPDGTSQRSPAGAGSRFQVRLPLEQTGVYQIELLARGENGITVVANFPVYVDEEVPDRLPIYASRAAEARTSEEVRDALITLVAEERERAGVPPLQPHPGLTAVAEAHCHDMAQNGFVGHESPTTGTPGDRLRAAGYASGLMLENVGRAYNADELHRGLMDSPGHRANILDSRVTHIGVAVVAVEEEGGRTAFIATEVFTQMTEAIDVESAPAQVLEAINAGRRARRAEPAATDELLTNAAQDAANAYFADPSLTQEDITGQAGAALRRFAIAYRRVGAMMTIVTDVQDATRLEPVFDPDVTMLGIGVAQGNRPDLPPNSIAVVIVLGWPR